MASSPAFVPRCRGQHTDGLVEERTGRPVSALAEEPTPGGSRPPFDPDTALARLDLDAVAAACRAEMGKRQRGEAFSDDFGAELFRRAVCDRDQAAWAAILAQYGALLIRWARRHPAYDEASADPEDIATRALARFWTAVGPDRFGRFGQFAAVLQYLKTCVHSVLMDEVRFRRGSTTEPLDDAGTEFSSHEDSITRRLEDQDLWQATSRLLPDEAAWLAIYLSYGLDLKPAEIHRRHPHQYGGVAEVYRVKRNAVDRLRRSPELHEYLAAS